MDIQSSVSQRAGVGRYTCALASELDKIVEPGILKLFYFDFQGKAECPARTNAVTRRVTWCPGRIAQLAWKTAGWPPFELFAGKADVYHFPNFILPPLRSGKAVSTIHDMTFKRFPEYTEEKNRKYLEARIKDTVERSEAVIAVSKFSAAEIVDLLEIEDSRVYPIHNGISNRFRRVDEEQAAPVLQALGITKPYLLFVGTLEPRKNIPFLVKTFENLRDFDGQLVLAGGLGWKYEPILAAINSSSRRDDIVHLHHADDVQLMALYSGASVFVFPSFYEGFGFPPLEAMACGTPVVSSTGGSLPEILADAAMLVDGFEVEEWTAALNRVLSDTALAGSLRNAGRKRSAEFTWETTAARTLEVYRKVAS
jgi:glycosyltransferase involved in cell wall biosynthesis